MCSVTGLIKNLNTYLIDKGMIMKKSKIVQMLIGAGLILAMPAAFAADADRIQALENQLKALQEQIEQLKATAVKSQEVAKDVVELRNQVDAQAKEVVVAGDLPNSFRVPGSETSVHLYGIAELNVTHDFKGYNGDNDYASFVPYAPLNNSSDGDRKGSTSFHTRTSRIGIEAATPSSFGLITGKLEGDFNNDAKSPTTGYTSNVGTEQATNSYNFRLRHAYVQAGSWVIGQTWTTFMDMDAAPETVDFNGPVGTTSMRQAQIRYSYRTPTIGNYTAALENNDSYVLSPTGSTYNFNKAISRTPDVVLRWDRAADWGTLSARAVTQEISLKDADTTTSTRGWGFGTSATVKMFGDDLLSLNLTGGDGIGRYFNYIEGAGYDSTQNKIVRERTVGTVLGYQHKFNEEYRLDFAYGYQRSLTNNFTDWARANGLDSGRYAMNRDVWQGHIGGFWNPTKVIEIGVEAIYGQRKTLANEKGDVSRINFLTRYYFN
jgi:hypothetical protein